jgi:hypothetical protein
MLQHKHFHYVNSLLFDGESSLASKKVQDTMFQQYQLKIRADPGFKRTGAERAIREFKTRLRIALTLQSTLSRKKYIIV